MVTLRVPEESSSKWYTTVCDYYAEPWRYYHTLNHINELFAYFDQWHPKLRKAAHVELAIWFHDVIYQPKSSVNEEESVKLFVAFCEDTAQPPTLCSVVSNYIIATKSHKINDADDDDLKYFLDFDLSILGKPEPAYDIYADQIRNEYIHYSDKDFCNGRIKVLNHLASGGLFITKDFQDLLEEKAKRNLLREAKTLQEKLATI